MTKPTPSQEKILKAAAKNPDCDIRDFMTHITIRSVSEKVFQTMLANGWIEENKASAYFITAAGCAVVGATPAEASAPKPSAKPDASTPKQSKQQIMIALLKREEGATLHQLVAATGWQKHSVHGAMAGVLKKKLGLTIESGKNRDGERTYKIA